VQDKPNEPNLHFLNQHLAGLAVFQFQKCQHRFRKLGLQITTKHHFERPKKLGNGICSVQQQVPEASKHCFFCV